MYNNNTGDYNIAPATDSRNDLAKVYCIKKLLFDDSLFLLNEVKNVDVDELNLLLHNQNFLSIVEEYSIYGPPHRYYIEKNNSFEPQTKV